MKSKWIWIACMILMVLSGCENREDIPLGTSETEENVAPSGEIDRSTSSSSAADSSSSAESSAEEPINIEEEEAGTEQSVEAGSVPDKNEDVTVGSEASQSTASTPVGDKTENKGEVGLLEESLSVAASADYPVYSSLSELMDAADLVVSCTALRSEQADVDIGDGLVLPYIVTAAEVTEVFSGDAAEGDTIEVKQLIQSTDPSTSGDYLLIDQEYLLFLSTYENTPASMLNPTQAQYVIDETGNVIPHPAQYAEITISSLDELRKGEQKERVSS